MNNRRVTRCLPLAIALASTLAAACENQLPPEPPAGRSIKGTISYAGDEHKMMAQPALRIYAFSAFPPMGSPHGLYQIEDPDFTIKPIAYELRNLPVSRFRIVSQIVDLAKPVTGATTGPAGGFPSYCALSNDTGWVTIKEIGVVENLDITLYNGAGTKDPCHLQIASVCPPAGKATIELNISSKRTKDMAGPSDSLIFAILPSYPSRPTRLKQVEGNKISYPYALADNEVDPGEWVVYLCYDVGGNNLQSCGPEDSLIVHPDMAKLNVPADKITSLQIDLDAKTAVLTGSVGKAERGCQ